MSPDPDVQNLLPCPCCGSLVIGEAGGYEICRICDWEDDPVQSADPDRGGGANRESLNQAKEIWRDGRRLNPRLAPKLPS